MMTTEQQKYAPDAVRTTMYNSQMANYETVARAYVMNRTNYLATADSESFADRQRRWQELRQQYETLRQEHTALLDLFNALQEDWRARGLFRVVRDTPHPQTFTVETISRAFDISYATWSQLERGIVHKPSKETIAKLVAKKDRFFPHITDIEAEYQTWLDAFTLFPPQTVPSLPPEPR